MAGSSRLDDEQQLFFLERFGWRYVAVQEQPLRPSRRVRRGRPRDATDVRVSQAQADMERRLRAALIRPGQI